MFPHKGTFPPIPGAPNIAPSNPMIGDNQWMSQNAYQNIDLEKVDWAILAQQWIHMKESCVDTHVMPSAPPPPRFTTTLTDYEEKGEAPMEVEHDEEQVSQTNESALAAPPAPTNIFHSNNWNAESNSRPPNQKQWHKRNRWSTPNQNHSKSHRMQNDGYASGQVFNAKQSNWSGSSTTNASPFSHSSNSNDAKMVGSDASSKSGTQLEQIGLNATPTLDAAQRKTLPAWIREGLEKMEREKQRHADRDREMKERDEKRRQEKLVEQNFLMQLNANDSSPKLPAKSKFESDSDTDNDDTVNSDYNESVAKAKVERATVGSSTSANAPSSAPAMTFKPHRTKAEILTEIMLSVRKNLTEILLEVTNEAIHAIAQDTLSKVQSKGRKAQSVQKNALTAKTSALGLVGYADSDASRSSGSDSEGETVDSDSDLMRSIQIRKAAFESKSIEIESYLADHEEREKQWLDKDDNKVDELKTQLTQSTAVVGMQSKSNEYTGISSDTQKVPIASKSERKNSRFSDGKSLLYNLASSQLTEISAPSQSRSSHSDQKSAIAEPKKHDSARKSDDSDSSRKRSKHSSKSSRSRSPSSRKHKKSSKRRSSSSSSDRSSYSRHSERSRKHSRRDRSSSDDRTSKSSQSSHKLDKHSREKSYSRSHSYKRSRH